MRYLQGDFSMTAGNRYVAYATSVESDPNLAGYIPEGEGESCDIRVAAEQEHPDPGMWKDYSHAFASHGRDIRVCSDHVLETTVLGQRWALEIADVARFSWRSGDPVIRYRAGHQSNARQLAFWLIHFVLPGFLTVERGFSFLHAGAVEADGAAIIFAARSRSGKSTLIDTFVGMGYSLVADDRVATLAHNDQFHAAPSHPNYRPYRRHEDLGLRAANYCTGSVPIRAICMLKRARADHDIVMQELHGFDKADLLLPNVLFGFRFQAARQFAHFGRLVNDCTMYELTIPQDLRRLGEVCTRVLEGTGLANAGPEQPRVSAARI